MFLHLIELFPSLFNYIHNIRNISRKSNQNIKKALRLRRAKYNQYNDYFFSAGLASSFLTLVESTLTESDAFAVAGASVAVASVVAFSVALTVPSEVEEQAANNPTTAADKNNFFMCNKKLNY
jgi:hypothetical protein